MSLSINGTYVSAERYVSEYLAAPTDQVMYAVESELHGYSRVICTFADIDSATRVCNALILADDDPRVEYRVVEYPLHSCLYEVTVERVIYKRPKPIVTLSFRCGTGEQLIKRLEAYGNSISDDEIDAYQVIIKCPDGFQVFNDLTDFC